MTVSSILLGLWEFFLVTLKDLRCPQDGNLPQPSNNSSEQYLGDQVLPKLLLHALPSCFKETGNIKVSLYIPVKTTGWVTEDSYVCSLSQWSPWFPHSEYLKGSQEHSKGKTEHTEKNIAVLTLNIRKKAVTSLIPNIRKFKSHLWWSPKCQSRKFW